MTQPESRLSAKILKALRAEGIFCFKVHGSDMMMAGLPDIVACVGGRFVGLETKMPGKRHTVTPRQQYVHDEIRKSDGLVSVVCSVHEALEVVHEVESS